VHAEDRVLRAELTLNASVGQVWDLWTTEAGLTSFFAPAAKLEPRVDGLFEIHFAPAAPAGSRGAEGLRVIGFEPRKRFAFTWNAPETQPYARAQRTVVYIDLEALPGECTKLTFTHAGWGTGPEWDAAYDYFDKAWAGFVLPMFAHRVANGPVDWKHPPKIAPLGASIKLRLVPAVGAGQSH
jgi:uncharacterized protein YndB with AHSA1/START domain